MPAGGGRLAGSFVTTIPLTPANRPVTLHLRLSVLLAAVLGVAGSLAQATPQPKMLAAAPAIVDDGAVVYESSDDDEADAGRQAARPADGAAAVSARRDARIREHVGQMMRIERIHGRLATAAAEAGWCPKAQQRGWVGATLLDRPDGESAAVFERLYGVGPRPTVAGVAADSPAALAGLRAGDMIESLGGAPVGDARDVLGRFAGLTGAVPVELQVRRRGAGVVTLKLAAAPACPSQVTVLPRTDANAYSDGSRVTITQGMVRFAARDEDLALVMGHEIAHGLLGHAQEKQRNAQHGEPAGQLLAAAMTAGVRDVPTIDGFIARSQARSYETEADTMALYLMALAGYAIDEAPTFWWRLASVFPVGARVGVGAEHPSPALRESSMRRTVERIRAERAAGRALKLPAPLSQAIAG